MNNPGSLTKQCGGPSGVFQANVRELQRSGAPLDGEVWSETNKVQLETQSLGWVEMDGVQRSVSGPASVWAKSFEELVIAGGVLVTV